MLTIPELQFAIALPVGVAALIALRFYPFPFIVVIAGVALWFMSMDLAAYLAGNHEWQLALGQRVSIGFEASAVICKSAQ